MPVRTKSRRVNRRRMSTSSCARSLRASLSLARRGAAERLTSCSPMEPMDYRGPRARRAGDDASRRVLHLAGGLRARGADDLLAALALRRPRRRAAGARRLRALSVGGREPHPRPRQGRAAPRLLQRLPPPRHAALRGRARTLRRRDPVPVPRLDLRARRRAPRRAAHGRRALVRQGRAPARRRRRSPSGRASLFVSLAERPRPLEEALRAAARPLRAVAAGRARRPRGRIDYDVRANWKLIFQNFSECYHCPPVHPALAKLSHYRSGANNLRDGRDPRRLHAHQREGRQPDDERPALRRRRSATCPTTSASASTTTRSSRRSS